MKTVNFEGKSYRFPDDATDAEITGFLGGGTTPQKVAEKPADKPKPTISREDRAAYHEALPGTLDGMTRRAEIEQRYGGRDAFMQQFDPAGEFIGTKVMPPVVGAALSAAPFGIGQAMKAPVIPITGMARNMAQGTVPTALEPGAGAAFKGLLDTVGTGAKAAGRGAKAAAEDPRVQKVAKWLSHLITAAIAGEVAGRAAGGRYGR